MPNREAINKQKVYTREKYDDANPWAVDNYLYWTGGETAKGSSQTSSANFVPITPLGVNQPVDAITQDMIDYGKALMQYGLEYHVGLSRLENGFPRGKWVMVTKLDSLGNEIPRFIGQFWRAGLSIQGGQTAMTASAQGYDRVLSTYNLLGAVHRGKPTTGSVVPIQFDSSPWIFNLKNRPNRSATKETISGSDCYVFDSSIYADKNGTFWEPSNVVEYILNRISGGTFNIYETGKKFLPFHNKFTNTQLTLDGIDPFTTEVKIREYDPRTTNIWSMITQMVETNGKYTTTINYGGTTSTDFHARIEVIQNV